MDEAKTIVVGNKVFRPLLDDTVTEADWKVAEVELNETPESRALALTIIKALLAGEKDLTCRTDDSYILKFLRVRKFDIDRVFKLICEHWKFRAKYSDCFPSPSCIEKALRSNIYNYLPHRDHKGRAIFVVKLEHWNPSEVSYADFVAAGNLFSEYVLDNTVTQINGYIGIWDFKGFSLKQFLTFCSPKHITLLTCLMQDRFPGRFKIAYCVNTHAIAHKAWSIFRVVMKEKFRKRIKILCSDMTALHQYLDPSILPMEYGGVMPPSDCQDLAQRVLDNEPFFNYNRKFGYNKNDIHKLREL